MMYADHQSLEASALSRHQAGLGLSVGQTGAAAIDTGSAYLRSGGDALVLFDGLFKFMTTAAITLPPPVNAIVGVVSWLGGSGLKVVRGFLERSARHCAMYLPIAVSEKVVSKFKSAWLTYASDAAKDKIVQASKKNNALRLALLALNQSTSTKLNLNSTTRLATRIYKSAISAGASKADAAMACWFIAKDSGASQNTLNSYAKLTGAKTSFDIAAPYGKWGKGKNRVSANQAKAAGAGQSSGNTQLLMAAAGLGVLLLVMQGKKK